MSNEVEIIDCNGLPFSLALLSTILRKLNATGSVTIRNMEPGSVNLAALARKMNGEPE